MTTQNSRKKTTQRSPVASKTVEDWLAALDHPHKPEILALRQIILSADASIAEGVKWNAPSFRTAEYFATFHLRAREGVQIILHLGVKKRDAAKPVIADPETLLEWLAKDRASVKFRDLKEIEAKRAAFTNVICQWIKFTSH